MFVSTRHYIREIISMSQQTVIKKYKNMNSEDKKIFIVLRVSTGKFWKLILYVYDIVRVFLTISEFFYFNKSILSTINFEK